jgi:Alpha galactosidase A/Alpha galactosidase C-terminal beta sandwich domain/Carbohydrate binding module (family 6)
MRPRLGRRMVVALSVLTLAVSSAVVGVLLTSNASASNNGLSITPAMGWSSWSFVRRNPTEATIKAQAAAMHNSGLAAHGFVYVNVDDFYQKCDSNGFTVDGFGRWVVDTAKFPAGMKALGDYIHGLGLKFGVYVTPGIPQNAVTRNTPIEGTALHATDIADTSKTEKNYNCKHMYFINYTKPGAQEYVNSFANMFASWGADYLKIDGVGAADIPDVQAWDKALRQTGRPINFALSNNLPIANATTWKQLANSWRTQGDVECYCSGQPNGVGYPLTDWSHVSARFNSTASWQPYAGPGGWNDYDSLEIGNGTNTGLTPDQRRSHMTLWAMAASPLLLGTDLTHLDPTDLTMLTNDRIIAIDQDGIAAKRIINNGTQQAYSKKEPNGTYAVALFNTATSGNQTITVNWSQVGFTGTATTTDLWSGTTTGTATNTYTATLRPGETRLIRAVPGSVTPPPANRYEAESGTCDGTIDSDHTGFSGTGFCNTNNAVGAAAQITVQADTAGPASLTIRYANGTTTDRPMDISVNGTVVAAAHTFPNTGNWDTWTSTTITANLNAGANTIRLVATTANGGPNLDYVEN